MDDDDLKSENEHIRSLIKEHKRRLHLLERQQAQQGIRVDPGIETE